MISLGFRFVLFAGILCFVPFDASGSAEALVRIGRVDVESTPAIRVAQSRSPDDSAVSVLFTDFSARTTVRQCTEQSSAFVTVTVQPFSNEVSEMTINVRGFLTSEGPSRSLCLATMNGQVVSSGGSSDDGSFLLRAAVDIRPEPSPVIVNLLVSCSSHGGPGSDGLVEIDTLDIRIRRAGEE